MKKKMLSFSILLVLMFTLVACNSGSQNGTQEIVVLRLGHGTATDSLYHAGSEKFKELVESKSEGKIKVELYPNGQLGHDQDLTEGMKLGTIEMGMVGLEPLTTLAPKMSVINLPFLFLDRPTAYRILDGQIGDELGAELPKDHGIRVLGYFENGFRNITNSRKPIYSPSDLSGLKLRTPASPVSLAIFKALGANPTPMSFGELYTALEQKTVDGQENPLSLIYTSKFYEVQDYISLTGHMYSPMALTISEQVWTSLSDDLKDIVKAAANEAKNFERKLSEEQEQDLIKKLEESGTSIIEVDKAPFAEATKDVYLEFVDVFGMDFYDRLLDEINNN